jgi:hypothetical protein
MQARRWKDDVVVVIAESRKLVEREPKSAVFLCGVQKRAECHPSFSWRGFYALEFLEISVGAPEDALLIPVEAGALLED